MPVPPATKSNGVSMRSGKPNDPNGPSRSSGVPGECELQVRIEPAAVLDLTSTCMMPDFATSHGAEPIE